MNVDLKRFAIKQEIKFRKKDSSLGYYFVHSGKGNEYVAKIFYSIPKINSKMQKKIELLSSFHHPSLLKCIGYSQEGFNSEPHPAIIYEYCKPLKKVLDDEFYLRSPSNWDNTAKLISIYGIASGIAYLHKCNITLSSLNTGSIFLDEKYYPKIDIYELNDISLDSVYIAPEKKYQNKSIDEYKCDVYSFGCISYEILSRGDVITRRGPDFATFSEEIREFLVSCLNEIPSERPSFSQIVDFIKDDPHLLFDDIDEVEFNKYVKYNEAEHTNLKNEKKCSQKVSSEKVEKEENYFYSADEEANFENVGKIGEGRTSITYKLIDKRTHVPVCMKVLKIEGATIEDVKNAQKEFQVLHSLHHPCICRSIAINPTKVLSKKTQTKDEVTTVALFIEFIDFTLKDCLAKDIVRNTLKARIVVEISHGMKYIHSKKMIYRDLKIDNIMLNSVFQAKLIDFGLVSINEILFDAEMIGTLTMTKNVGDDEFMSPEMMNDDDDYDNKTDVYSFGVIVYFLFVGKMPNQSIKDKSMKKKIKMPDVSPSVSKCCIDLMSMCLEIDPKTRPSFNEILIFLRENKYMLADDVDSSIVSQRDQELESYKD
ncbi:hypothetical protein M9Y10_027079 [Tritrichomonas musculus]|uniref:Protein kinase domain-containing protein n=1 Tax=Tritrichomonas musculus TaxID=1915356 RepID=A0ABR2H6J9_9EUKA